MLDASTQLDPRLSGASRNRPPLMSVRGLSLWYEEKQVLKDVSFDLCDHEVLAFIGPPGCGKTTSLKCLNRMHDGTRGVRIAGKITMHGQDIHAREVDPSLHRARFGWVAQRPKPFASTIFENVAYGARSHGIVRKRWGMDDHVEQCLRRALLWDEVKDILHKRSGHDLSGGQQQRLCIARALSTNPKVLLMDEPTGSIDPMATAEIEQLMVGLREDHTVVTITRSLTQARRIADRVAYFHLGALREIASTETMFTAARDPNAHAFIGGEFG
ncbi:MAG: phosphate ABC transporter ATP-binding protein [Pseudomonadota bacterium]